jgi:hypothetical protein
MPSLPSRSRRSSPASGFLLCLFVFGIDKLVALLLLVFPDGFGYRFGDFCLRSVIGLGNAVGDVEIVGQLRRRNGELVLPIRNCAHRIVSIDQCDLRSGRKADHPRINLERRALQEKISPLGRKARLFRNDGTTGHCPGSLLR